MSNQIYFDSKDWNSMEKLMDEYGDSIFPFRCINDQGETVLLSINPDNIVAETFQNNGWVRKNVYYREDHLVEETYEK